MTRSSGAISITSTTSVAGARNVAAALIPRLPPPARAGARSAVVTDISPLPGGEGWAEGRAVQRGRPSPRPSPGGRGRSLRRGSRLHRLLPPIRDLPLQLAGDAVVRRDHLQVRRQRQ